MTKQIPLTQGLLATVDDADFEWLNQWKWYAAKIGKTFYAVRADGKFPFRKHIYMHTEIMSTPKGMKTDHRDHDGLNNTRVNLRNCTHAQNQQNRDRLPNNTSGYKGVSWNKGKWQAHISVDNKLIGLGRFSDVKDAARAYNEAAKNFYGEFALLNVIPND